MLRLIQVCQNKRKPVTITITGFRLAGETGFEPATHGFGDRYSTS